MTDGQYCHVLVQRQTGKTSLIASTATRLRKNGVAVAIVDLTRASGEDVSENVGRWYYSVAYRIVRDLRIKTDIQAWWKDRGGLTNLQRFREFFLEIVLTDTEMPVVICLDRIEATIGQPLAQDLFTTVRSCYDARATQVDFQRLTFVLTGSASPGEIVKNLQDSVFEISRSIDLPDFSPQELSGLVAGLGTLAGDPEAIVRRVWSWTRGHPYLSQKVMRGLARSGTVDLDPARVDELVRNQFLAPNAISEEPHLASIAEQLVRNGQGKSQRLNLYGRIRKGIEVMAGADTGAQHELMIGGVIAEDAGGELRVRNEIYAMVFDTRWVNQNLSFGLKGLATAAALILALVVVPVWYTEYLPRPYVRALAATSTNYASAVAAHESLASIPGYAGAADRLLADYLAAKTSRTLDYSSVLQPIARLRLLPDGAARADELFSDFWDRTARSLMHIGDRDGALVAVMESMQQDTQKRRSKLSELIGEDYDRLIASRHSDAVLQSLVLTNPQGVFGWLDEKHNVQLWQLRQDQLIRLSSLALYAEEQPDLVLRAMVTRSGSRPRLTVRINHPRPEQVIINMQAPSGQRAALSLSRAKQISEDSYRFDFATFTRLQNMRGAELVGNWTIAISDIEQGESGDLLAWSLDFAEARRPVDSVLIRQPIPEPRPSENARTRLASNGSHALSWPADSATRGPVVVWDVEAKNIIARIPRRENLLDARFIGSGDRVVTIEPRHLTVWNAQTGKRIGSVRIDELSDAPPAFSANGRYVATRKLILNDQQGIAVWDLRTLRQVGPVINISSSGSIAVDDRGTKIAVAGRDAYARVWSLQSGKLLYEYEHISLPRQLSFDGAGAWLASDDFSNTFRLWQLGRGTEPVVERLGNSPWRISFSADSTSLLVGSLDRAYELINLPEGTTAGIHLWHSVKNSEKGMGVVGKAAVGPLIFADSNLAVTTDGARDIKLWRIPNASVRKSAHLKTIPSGSRATLSGDGKRIAIGDRSGQVRIYAVGAPGSVELAGIENRKSGQLMPIAMEFSADRSLLATASMDGGLRVWNPATGAPADFVTEHSDGVVHDIAFSSAATLVISASRREVLITNTRTGRVTNRLRIQANHPQLAVAADTPEVFIADDLDGVTAWDWRADQTRRIVDESFGVRRLAITPDGALLVTAGADRVLRLWDTATLKMLPQTVQSASKVDDMWISADGRRLIAHAGHWLHAIELYASGLAMQETRLLATSPAAVQPLRDGSAAYLLLAAPGRPVVMQQPLDAATTEPATGDAGELRAYWRRRLSMTITVDGIIEPM